MKHTFASLADRRVLIVGAGGLGSPAAMYLAAAGVGTIGLVDVDTVDETNLQRQILYGTADIGRNKLSVAHARLTGLNPAVTVVRHDESFDVKNALTLTKAYDVVVDGTDNFTTRYLVNDACVITGTPNVYGSVFRFEGQASVFAHPGGPCYRCLHPEPPPAGLIPNCAEAGVLGVLPGVIGTVQATEAIKLLTGIGEPLVGRLLLYDALRMRFREIALPRDPTCAVCGDTPSIRDVVAYDYSCEVGSGASTDVTVARLADWRSRSVPHFLVDVREPFEHAMSRIEGAVLIPIGQIEERLAVLPRDRPIVVHCQSGGRSSRAASRLRGLGFDARSLSGGIKAWREVDTAREQAERAPQRDERVGMGPHAK